MKVGRFGLGDCGGCRKMMGGGKVGRIEGLERMENGRCVCGWVSAFPRPFALNQPLISRI